MKPLRLVADSARGDARRKEERGEPAHLQPDEATDVPLGAQGPRVRAKAARPSIRVRRRPPGAARGRKRCFWKKILRRRGLEAV